MPEFVVETMDEISQIRGKLSKIIDNQSSSIYAKNLAEGTIVELVKLADKIKEKMSEECEMVEILVQFANNTERKSLLVSVETSENGEETT